MRNEPTMKSNELSIGEFSKATGLTVKTLRFYHERGLLIPARVEAGSGYRFFDKQNLETAKIICALRELEFSLDDIQSFLVDGDQSDKTVVAYLETRKSEVQEKIQNQRGILAKLDRVIAQEKANQQTWNDSTFEVERRELEPMLIGGIRMTGQYSDMGNGFSRLGRSLGRHIAGPGMCLYFDEDARDDDANFEPFFPLRRSVKVEGISVRELEGGTAICIKHRGPYQGLGRSYARIFEHAKELGLQRVIPSREVFLKGPGVFFRGKPAKYLTEIQFIVNG